MKKNPSAPTFTTFNAMLKLKLARISRIIRAGFCFLTFGVGALSIFLLIFPLINIFSDRKNKQIFLRQTIHLSWKIFVFIMSSLGLISVKIRNFEELQKTKGQIIVANHPSLIDIVILISYIPNADCIVKGQLANNIFMKGIVKSLYIVNSNNAEELLALCQKSLDSGNNLIIFPEGTRTSPNQKSKILRGAAQIALHSKRDILPIRINCHPLSLLKGQKWYQVANEKLNFYLEIKPKIAIKSFLNKTYDKSLLAREITEEIRQSLEINT